LQVAKVRRQMLRALRRAKEPPALTPPAEGRFPIGSSPEDQRPADAIMTGRASAERLIEDDPDQGLAGTSAAAGPFAPSDAVDLHREFRGRFAWYISIRDWLRDHRVRTHLISGIEFQMAVFIIGPLVDMIVPVTVGAAALLLVFEVAIVFKLWL